MDELVQTLLQILPGKVFQPGVTEYEESLTSYFSAQESRIRPACIVRPSTTAEVSKTVILLLQANQRNGLGSIKFAVRSGGHASFAKSANEPNGVTIDLRGIHSIKVQDNRMQVVIGAGASWGEVYRTLDPLGLAVPGGRHSQVGVGGLTLGGKSVAPAICYFRSTHPTAMRNIPGLHAIEGAWDLDLQ